MGLTTTFESNGRRVVLGGPDEDGEPDEDDADELGDDADEETSFIARYDVAVALVLATRREWDNFKSQGKLAKERYDAALGNLQRLRRQRAERAKDEPQQLALPGAGRR